MAAKQDLSEQISKMMLDVIPMGIRAIRSEVRTAAKPELSVPQLRILAHLYRGISDATSLAEIQGVSLPAISKMVDLLVGRNLVRRETNAKDRRQANLSLTDEGSSLFQKSRKAAQDKFRLQISKLNKTDQTSLNEAFKILEILFSSHRFKKE